MSGSPFSLQVSFATVKGSATWYGSWTENRITYPPHTGRPADAAGVAAVNHYTRWASPARSYHFATGRWRAGLPHCDHGGDQSTLCLQVGAALHAGRDRGAG